MDNTKSTCCKPDLAACRFLSFGALQRPFIQLLPVQAASYSSGSKVRAKEKSSLGDLAALAIRVLGLLALKH